MTKASTSLSLLTKGKFLLLLFSEPSPLFKNINLKDRQDAVDTTTTHTLWDNSFCGSECHDFGPAYDNDNMT